MATTLTNQFLAYLQAKFGITISNPNDLMMGSGSSVTDSSLKAAAASTASASTTGAVSSAASSGSSLMSSVPQIGMEGAQLYSSYQQSNQAKAAAAAQQTYQQEQQAQFQASQAQNASQAATQSATQASQAASQAAQNALNTQQNLLGLTKNTTLSQLGIARNNELLANLSNPAAQQAINLKYNILENQANLKYDQGMNNLLNPPSANASATAASDGIPFDIAAPSNSDMAGLSDPMGEFPSVLYGAPGTAPVDPIALIAANPPNIETTSATSTGFVSTETIQPYNQPGLTTQNLQWGMSTYLKAGIALGAGFGLFESVKSLTNGFNVGGLLGAGTSVLGLWKSLSSMHSLFANGIMQNGLFSNMPWLQSAMHFLTSGPGIAIIIGLIVLLALLLGIAKNTTPAAVELPVVAMPSVWTSMPVLFMSAGIALAGAGISLGPTAPVLQTITVPTVQLTSALNAAGLTDTNGNAIGSGAYSLAGSVFVSKGTGSGGADQVVYVTQGANGQSIAHVDTLKGGMQFAAPASPSDVYINFFNGSQANSDAVQGVQNSAALAQAASALGNSAGANALQLSASASKSTTVKGGPITTTGH